MQTGMVLMNWPWVLGAWDISVIKKNSPILSEFTFWDISDETHCILVNLVILLDILVQDNFKFIFWFEDNTHYKYRPLDNQVTYRPKNFFCERVLRRLKETLSIFSSKTDSHHAGFYAFTPLLDVCFHRIEALLFMEAHNIHLIDLSWL